MNTTSEIKKYDVLPPYEKYKNEILRIIAILVTIYGAGSLVDSFSKGISATDQNSLLMSELKDLRSNSTDFSMVDLIPDSAGIIESMGIMDVDTHTGLRNTMAYLSDELNKIQFDENSSMNLIVMELEVFKSRLLVTEDDDLPRFVRDFRQFLNKAITEIKHLPEHLGRFLLSLFIIATGYFGAVKTKKFKVDFEQADEFNKSARMVEHTLNTMLNLFDPKSTVKTIPLTVKNQQNLVKYNLATELKDFFSNSAPLPFEKPAFVSHFKEINEILRKITYAKDNELIECIRAFRKILTSFHSTLVNHSKQYSIDAQMTPATLFYVTHLGELIRIRIPSYLDRISVTEEESVLAEA